MSAEPLTPEEIRYWTTLNPKSSIEGNAVAIFQRFSATIDRLSQELKAAREERPGIAIDWESVAKRNAAEGDEALSRALAAEERANRYQMQYEEECECHGDHIGALEKCQARIGDLERERHPLDVRRIAELQAELDRVDRERAAAEAERDELERELEDIETLPGLKRALIAERRAVAAEERANRYQMQYEEECEVHGDTRALLAQRDEALERDRILWNEGREEIDEIVVHGCTVHVEQMSDRHWWMAAYKGEGARRFVLDFSVLPGRRKAMTCTGYDDCVEGGPWVWGEDSEHESPAARDGEAP